MTLYARSDMACIGISVSNGGCGNVHIRPVRNGAPVKVWGLDCEKCEAYLRGDSRQKVINVTPGNKDKGIPSRLVHVADADPHWSATPEGIPQTPDEQHIYKLRTEQGKQQLDMLQAYAALSKVPGLDLKDFAEAKWMLDQTLDPLKRPVVEGSIVCVNGHDNPAGKRFCGECGASLETRAAIEDVYEEEPAIPLASLHVATLRKMCRERGLPDKGKKEELISRLTV